MAKAKGEEQIQILPPETTTIEVEIIGTEPLIVHRFGDKAKRMFEESQQRGVKKKKESRDPESDYQESMYRLEDGSHAFPATAFKAAVVGAAREIDGLHMVTLKPIVWIKGEGRERLVRIIGTPERFDAMVRIAKGASDMRYRAMFPEWSTLLTVTYRSDLLDRSSLLSLFARAGLSGVGEWRPSSPKSATGGYGTFRVGAVFYQPEEEISEEGVRT